MGDEVSCQPTFLTYLQCYCATSRTREAGAYIKQTEYTHTQIFSLSRSHINTAVWSRSIENGHGHLQSSFRTSFLIAPLQVIT